MDDLLNIYKETLKVTRKRYQEASEEDKRIVSGIITDLEIAIKWMETGRAPNERKGIQKKNPYSQGSVFDPSLGQFIKCNLQTTPFEKVDMRIDKECALLKHA